MTCTQCGTPALANARFCANCGAPLVAPKPLEGERKLVTVMFADVVGSTAMAERLDPEQISEIMGGAFAFMNAAVARYGGTVSRLMGDAVLALFGAPTSHEDDPERAVRAALDIQEAAHRYEHTVRRAYGVDFAVRVGLHTGLAVLATVGDAIRAEYTAMGDTPNVAARVQSAARPGTVLITTSTLRHVREIAVVEPHEPVAAKGKSEPLEVHVVRGIREAAGRPHGVAGLRSPLVGRDAERAALQAAIGGLADGKGAFVALVAEAGLGKSRLLEEIRNARPEGVAWLEGRASSYGQSIAHHVWRDLLRTEFGEAAAESPARTRSRVAAALEPLGLGSDEVAAIESLLGVPGDETTRILSGLDTESFLPFVTAALRRWLATRAGGSGCVLVFDDLHWADTGSLALIEAFARSTHELPVVVFATTRPERASPGWATLERLRATLPGIQSITLEPLDAAATRALLDNLLQIDNLPVTTRDVVLKRSDGNPFFVEEVLRSLIDAGHLYQHEGRWRAHPDIVSATIPETLSGVLTARIDRLPDRARKVIQTASVIGRNFPFPVLARVCDNPAEAERIDDPQRHMDTLTEEGLVHELHRLPELDYAFKHALTQEAAYALLLLRRRRELHRRTAVAIEGYYGERTDEMAPILARHFYEGEEWGRAADYAMEAAQRALDVYQTAEALALMDLAVQAFDRDPDAAATDKADAVLLWAELAFKVRPREEILARLQEVERLSRETRDDRRLARTLNWIGNAHILSGFPYDGMSALTEALELSRRLGDEQGVMLPMFLTTMAMVDADPTGALPRLDEVISASRRFKDRDVEAHTIAAKAEALARLGRFPEALAALAEAMAIVPMTHSPIKEADVNAYAGMVHLLMGDPQAAARHGQIAAERAASVQGFACAAAGHMIHGMACLASGETDTALGAFQTAEGMAHGEGAAIFRNRINGYIGLTRLRQGVTEARSDVAVAIETAQRVGDPTQEAAFNDQLGKADLRAGQVATARQELEAAVGYFRRKSMRPSLAASLGALSDAYAAQGDQAAADAARREHATLARELVALSALPESP